MAEHPQGRFKLDVVLICTFAGSAENLSESDCRIVYDEMIMTRMVDFDDSDGRLQ